MWYFFAALIGVLYWKRDAAASEVVAVLPDYEKFDSYFIKYGRIEGIPVKWLKAISIIESSLGKAASVAEGLRNPSNTITSVSSDGKSWGLMQVTLYTARAIRPQTTAQDLNNPDISVMLASKVMSENFRRFKGDMQSTIRAYNGGPNFKRTAEVEKNTQRYYERFLAALDTVERKQPDLK